MWPINEGRKPVTMVMAIPKTLIQACRYIVLRLNLHHYNTIVEHLKLKLPEIGLKWCRCIGSTLSYPLYPIGSGGIELQLLWMICVLCFGLCFFDRCNVASLLMVAFQNDLDYATEWVVCVCVCVCEGCVVCVCVHFLASSQAPPTFLVTPAQPCPSPSPPPVFDHLMQSVKTAV